MDKLRRLCIDKDWYTRGTNEEYSYILQYAENTRDIKTKDIIHIAKDILDHSDTDYPLDAVCFEIAMECISLFTLEKEKCYENKKLYGPGLCCISNSALPQTIEVPISDGNVFTIGRFDPCVGKKQSSFEFDKRTKGVSRRHAVVERKGSSYFIIDLSSCYGTFVNNKKIITNTPYELKVGALVSFGNLGVDYMWGTVEHSPLHELFDNKNIQSYNEGTLKPSA